uniref:G-protein coupled receptors family 1 profile domain-containing protein n=1 Tax=Varanus komodoensis TaxID=61221 RepID=A0A8D2L392_VARKO
MSLPLSVSLSVSSALTEFLLLGFSEVQEQQILHFVVFLSIYLATLTGNFLIILTVASDPQLHSPKYFFLINLSPSDMCYISTTVPKSMPPQRKPSSDYSPS